MLIFENLQIYKLRHQKGREAWVAESVAGLILFFFF